MKNTSMQSQMAEDKQPKRQRTDQAPSPRAIEGSETGNALDAPLTPEERKEKGRLEEQMKRGFIDICTAVLQIRDKRLYREDFGTFDEYAETILGLSRVHAHRLAEAGRVVQLLLAMGNLPVPTCERQARPLTKVGPELVPVVWRRALEESGTGRVTARVVEELVTEMLRPVPRVAAVNGGGLLSRLEENLLSIAHEITRRIKAHDLDQLEYCLEKMRLRIEISKKSDEAHAETGQQDQ
jgi:hypothetical protein